MIRWCVACACVALNVACSGSPGGGDALTGGDDVAPCRYETLSFRGVLYDVVTINLNRADVRLYWRRNDSTRLGTFPALRDWLAARGQKLLVATNGGIFLRGFRPEGLHVERGIVKVPLNTKVGWGNFYLKPNGVFAVTQRGALVVSTDQFALLARDDSIVEATQSGPMLVDHGIIHPVFVDTSEHYNVRSAVAAPRPDRVVLAVSRTEVTLFDLASFFRDRLRCNDVLYLDGDITRMYAPALGRLDTGSCAGMIGVVSK